MRSTNGVVGCGCALLVAIGLAMGCSGDVEGAGQGGAIGEGGAASTATGSGGTSSSKTSSAASAGGSSAAATGTGGNAGAATSGTGGSSGGAGGSAGSASDAGRADASQPPSDGGCQFSDVMPPELFAMLFPDIRAPYTYEGLA